MSDLIIIDDSNWTEHFEAPDHPDGTPRKKGLIPRNYSTHPVGCYAFAKPLPDELIIPRSEWKDRLAQQKADKARVIDIRNHGWKTDEGSKPIPSRDQDGKGYCWAHSSVSAMLLIRALMNEPYVDLSAFAVACIIKKYRDEGGWGAESLEWIAKNGVPTSEFWPQQSMKKTNDNPAMRENAALHKFVDWYDLEPRNLDHFVTACLNNWPIVSDFDWWGHSVCTMCLEEVGNDVSSLVSWILNSWGDGWSANGAGQLKGKKALPDAMLAACVSMASAA